LSACMLDSTTLKTNSRREFPTHYSCSAFSKTLAHPPPQVTSELVSVYA
jgi:hypothetical protein